MTTVYWGYHHNQPNRKWLELALIEPEPLLPYFIKQRNVSIPQHFTRCPAFTAYYKNTYVIKSPIDITITYRKEIDTLAIEPQDQNFYDSLITHRGNQIGADDPFLMSIALEYLFIADKDCLIELLPAYLHTSPTLKSVRVICGSFNIAKWFRPIEFAFEMLTPDAPLKIKREEPLFYVRFVPADAKKINLVHKCFPEETKEVLDSCLQIKYLNNNFQLNQLYEFAKRVSHKLWFKKKKCPFNWRNK
jgi:hypothetical protein